MELQLKETKHEYYCSSTNYYVGNVHGENHGLCEYNTWSDFKEECLGMGDDELGIDIDCNLCFRFDILQRRDEDDEPIEGSYELWLFFMLQRKGIFRPVWIKDIVEVDIPEIQIVLGRFWEYIKNQWAEFSQEN